ncbi:hypothetical protein GGF37_000146 [Kickxella alabastrina]|nr:hypothetical protein GGF37_000146 [Kickxella alabastrina]
MDSKITTEAISVAITSSNTQNSRSATPEPQLQSSSLLQSPLDPESSPQKFELHHALQAHPAQLAMEVVEQEIEQQHQPEASQSHGMVRSLSASRNLAVRALGRQSALPRRIKNMPYCPPGLMSPTDKLMSPATRGINNLKRRKMVLSKPRAFESIIESLKDKK